MTHRSVRLVDRADTVTRMGGITAAKGRRRVAGIRGTLVLMFAVVLAVAACGTPGKTAAGVVNALDSSGEQVTSFTLRTTDGQVMPFTIGALETDGAAFPASHLAVHTATLQPIAVAYREEGGRNVVYRLVDAP